MGWRGDSSAHTLADQHHLSRLGIDSKIDLIQVQVEKFAAKLAYRIFSSCVLIYKMAIGTLICALRQNCGQRI